MNMGDKDKFEMEKNSSSTFDSSRVSLDWEFSSANFTNANMGLAPISSPIGTSSCSSASMLDSHCPPWDHALISQNLGLCNINVENTTTQDFGWNPHSSMLKGGICLPNVRGAIPHSLPRLPTDSGFIERAARSSCFNGGIFNHMMTPFSIHESLSPHSRSRDEAKQGIEGSSNVSDEAEVSGGNHSKPCMLEESRNKEPSAVGLSSKKRKIRAQKPESDQVKVMSPHSGEAANEPSLSPNKNNTGKLGSQASDSYVHVRARRGQATNSHSLAERVRREKISERMKLLQDLVPGCNKVTGKAVMLDEIINYVQSLQRQVEFLSMKLATVNPQLGFTIDRLHSCDAPSSTMEDCSNANMTYPALLQLHTSQQGLVQIDFCNIGNSQLAAINGGYKEPTPLLPNSWEDELHNVVQMGFYPSTSTENQDLINGHTKIEP